MEGTEDNKPAKKVYEIIDTTEYDREIAIEEQNRVGLLICSEYAAGQHTIDSCCRNQGVAYRTFNGWLKSNTTLADLYKMAKEDADRAYRGELKLKCATSLMKLIEGYDTEEVHQEGEPIYDTEGNQVGMKTSKVKRVKKRVQPNVTAIIFALKSIDPDTYKHNEVQIETEPQVFKIGDKEIKF